MLTVPLLLTRCNDPIPWGGGGGGLLDFWNRGANVLISGLQFKVGKIILGSKILRFQMCYLWSEICAGLDYLWSDISSVS